jgi:hypothetical protein
MATASLDVLTAARALAARHGYQLDPGVLATGFSEGGAAAMALGRALQQGQSPFFRLTALAPISSPLDLAGAELPGIFNGQVAAAVAPYYIGYLLTSWNPLYHLYSSPSQVFRQPYAARVQGLYDGSHQDQQVIAALPPLSRLLTPAYLRLLRHPTGKFLRALNANSTCAGWTPRAPVRLYAASGDSQGTPVNCLVGVALSRRRPGTPLRGHAVGKLRGPAETGPARPQVPVARESSRSLACADRTATPSAAKSQPQG